MTTETSIYEYARHGLLLSPNDTAIWFYGKSITYLELFDKIDNVADHLYELGVRQGTVVTIHLSNCPQAVMAIYAVAKLGAVCNMVHPMTPIPALKTNMTFSESDFLITQNAECAELASVVLLVDVTFYMGKERNKDKNVQKIHRFEELEQKGTDSIPTISQKKLSSKCAVYLHSSGTTSNPKTVMHSHAAINRAVENLVTFLGLRDRTDIVELGVLPMFHGTGFAHVMHIIISNGAKLVQMLKWDTDQAIELIKKHRVSYITGMPKMFYALMEHRNFGGESLEQCFVAGDTVSPSLKIAFNRCVGRSSCLHEAYGLTELVAACCACDDLHENITATGYPLTNSQIAIWDGQLKSSGMGELVVHTNTMMLGYLHDAQATKSACVCFEGKKWLKTGDIGRIDDQGFIHYCGRKKDVIIRKGFNVYPHEIDAVSRSMPEVLDSCTVGIWDDESHTQKICSFVVLNANIKRNDTEKVLRSAWAERLPSFAIPNEVFFLAELPKTQMDKVDRSLLVKLYEQTRENRTE